MAADGNQLDSFLGVSRSLSGRRWRARPADEGRVRDYKTRLGLDEPLARALAARGVAPDDASDFLEPTLKALFPDPSSFADMDAAAVALLDAFEAETPSVIFADYDVDGATSAALLVRWFRAMGRDMPVYVPDRLTEGFGPSPQAFRKLHAEGARLVITVDCGAAAHDAIEAAHAIGLGLVVIDHHLMRDMPGSVAALVNPNRADCRSGQGVLSAAGVTFVLLAALNREARRRGLFATKSQPDPRAWLDLAALGAICDVTRLTGFNRALAVQGLKVMSAWRNPGLAALMDVAGAKKGRAGAFEAGFILGPRINAGGRVGRSDLGARLLSTDDPAEAADLAAELDRLNVERKAVEGRIFEEAVDEIERSSNLGASAPALVVAREGWHPGVVGIVASRLRERYRRPVIVLGVDGVAGIAKGSGRSQPGVNLGAAVQEAHGAGLLLAGGGHAMAAGLTLRTAMIPEFREYLCARLVGETTLAEEADALDIDVLVSPGAAARAMLGAFGALEPFGPGSPEPIYALADVRADRAAPIRGGHVRCFLADGSGARLKAIAWRAGDSPIGRRLLAGGGTFHVAGRLKPDDWPGGDGLQFEIEDIAEVPRPPSG